MTADSLTRLGGVPAKLVMDRDSSLVIRGRRPRPVDEFAVLLGALSMGHVVLSAYSPQSKGSVERMNGYLETSFLPLRRFEDLADLQRQHDDWAEGVAWPRHLRRLGGRVAEALAVERAVLAALPDPLPETDRRLEVCASRDDFARVAGIDYSLPPGYGLRRLRYGSRCRASRYSARGGWSHATRAATCPATWSATTSTWRR